MKKKFLVLMLVFAMIFTLAACSGSTESEEPAEEPAAEQTGEVPEDDEIVWAQGNSGNVLVSIAKQQGYFDELGLNVTEIPLDDGQLEAVLTGQVDIASNSGTWGPLQRIAAGDDMCIIGGHMLTGCMPVIAKEGTEFNGPEDFLGKKLGETKSRYALFHTLVEQGHDLDKEIEFVSFDNDSDKIAAVQKGEIDFATIGTGRMYEVLNTEGVEIVTYLSDQTPNYSCCRMVARDSWAQENPTTIKLLDQALIRAMAYFEAHREDCVDLMTEQLGATKEYVEAYMLNEHYRINPDPVRNIVMDNFEYMKSVGGIENLDENLNLDDRIYTDLYKQALDAAVAAYHDEAPEFYDNAVKFFEENNQ